MSGFLTSSVREETTAKSEDGRPLYRELRDKCVAIVGACDDLSKACKELQATTAQTKALWSELVKVRCQVVGLRNLAFQGQIVTAAMLAPVLERELEDCHTYTQHARPRPTAERLPLSGRDLAAGEGLQREEAAR